MALPDITKNPPAWEPNAVPTDTGWRHPETNELLVSLIKGCHPDAYVTEDEEEIPVEEEQEEEVAEETEAAEEQPQKPKKGKKK
jgi:hypothetical protein|nr:MAG TPA: hypothetical protein [Caudoviricetes sp.]